MDDASATCLLTQTGTAQFDQKFGIRLCLDVSHTKLACTHLGFSFQDAVELLAPVSSHLHPIDPVGEDGKGLQIEEGDVD